MFAPVASLNVLAVQPAALWAAVNTDVVHSLTLRAVPITYTVAPADIHAMFPVEVAKLAIRSSLCERRFQLHLLLPAMEYALTVNLNAPPERPVVYHPLVLMLAAPSLTRPAAQINNTAVQMDILAMFQLVPAKWVFLNCLCMLNLPLKNPTRK